MRIPVVIIGGFLGAGKTTVVNQLLRHSQQRTAVIVNDFGAMNIDEKLILRQDGDVFALTNGCVCCSLGPDFSTTLEQVLALSTPPNRIVVESSGVSDPWRIAQLVKLEQRAELEAVVVLADVMCFPTQLSDRWLTDTLTRQISRADLIALSKCDLADGKAKTTARSAIAAIRDDVPVIEISNGELPEIVINPATSTRAGRMFASTPTHAFRTWAWRPHGPLDEARLREVLERLPPAVLRGKGFFKLGKASQQAVFQLVGRRWSVECRDAPHVSDEVVLIGTKELPPPEKLEALFGMALVESKD